MNKLTPYEKDRYAYFKHCFDLAKQIDDQLNFPDDMLLTDVSKRIYRARELSDELVEYLEYRLEKLGALTINDKQL